MEDVLKMECYMTYLKKDTQYSKAIGVASRLATVGVLTAVPVYQVELQSEGDESLTVIMTEFSALF